MQKPLEAAHDSNQENSNIHKKQADKTASFVTFASATIVVRDFMKKSPKPKIGIHSFADVCPGGIRESFETALRVVSDNDHAAASTFRS